MYFWVVSIREHSLTNSKESTLYNRLKHKAKGVLKNLHIIFGDDSTHRDFVYQIVKNLSKISSNKNANIKKVLQNNTIMTFFNRICNNSQKNRRIYCEILYI
jgi:hypothetical protein